MPKKILVAYATRAGSTEAIAKVIGETLAAEGAAVDVLPIQRVAGLSGYQAVVLGSAVRYGSLLPEAVKFVEQNQAALAQLPLAVFAAHILNLGRDETSLQKCHAYLDAVRRLVEPRAEACFAGVGDPAKVALFERLLFKAIKPPQGDYRDWPAIRAWAESLKNVL